METPQIDQFVPLPVQPGDSQQRNAASISIITAGVMASASVIWLVYLNIIAAPLVKYLIIGITLLIAMCGLLSAWLCQRGKPQSGIIILLGGISVGTLAIPVAMSGQGLPFGLISGLMTLAIAAVALKGRSASSAIILGIGLAIYNIAFDFYGPVIAPQGDTAITLAVMIIVILVYLWVILRQYRQFSLRTKLVIAFVLVSFFPLLILSAINYQQSYQANTEETQTELRTWSLQVADSVDGFINDQLAAIYTESQLPNFQNYLSLPPEERKGSEIETEVRKIINLLQRRKSEYVRSYALLDINGVNLSDSDEIREGRIEKSQKYFNEAVQNGVSYVSDVFFEPEGPSLYFTSPVWNAKGVIVGVLRVQYNAIILHNTVMAVANKWNVPEMYAVLVDDQYFIRLSHSRDYGLMYKSYSLDNQTIELLQTNRRLPSGNPQDLTTDQPSMVAWLKNLEKQPFYTTSAAALGGADAVSSASRLQHIHWIVLTRQSLTTANAGLLDQFHVSVIWALAVVLIVSLTALMASQVLSAPIVRLTKVAEQVTKGELTSRAQVESADEIGILASTFNNMTDELARTLEGLEKRVAERTRGIELSADVSRRLSNILDPVQLVSEVVELLQFCLSQEHVEHFVYRVQMRLANSLGDRPEIGSPW